jgi:pimeloyl-ACP methyl ester carboxylesterase
VHTRYRRFTVPFDGRELVGDILAGEEDPRLLILHGAGQSCREHFRQLREHFWTCSVGSVAFDCIGHGDTGGDLESTSLQSRTEQASAVVEAVSLSRPFSVLAGSMGGYTAVTLLPRHPIANLILVCPAMYATEAYAIPFNRGFTEVIRRPNSWETSDAWSLLTGFTGRLLIVAGEKDTIIPFGVIRHIYEAARNAAERTLYIATGASHLIITDLRAQDPKQLSHVLDLMTWTLRGTEDRVSSSDRDGKNCREENRQDLPSVGKARRRKIRSTTADSRGPA